MNHFARNLLLLFATIVVFSIGGLGAIVGPIAMVGVLVIVLTLVIPSSRNEHPRSRSGYRRARKVNFLAQYNEPSDAIGRALLLAIAVKECFEALDQPFVSEAALGLAVALALMYLLPPWLARWAEDVLAFAASIALVSIVLVLPATDWPASRAMFGAAVLCVGVVFVLAWGFGWPRKPMLARGRLQLLAMFGLLELAAALVVVQLPTESGLSSAMGIWEDTPLWPKFVGLGCFFFIALCTAYGPKFMVGLIGITLMLLTVYYWGVEFHWTLARTSVDSLLELLTLIVVAMGAMVGIGISERVYSR